MKTLEFIYGFFYQIFKIRSYRLTNFSIGALVGTLISYVLYWIPEGITLETITLNEIYSFFISISGIAIIILLVPVVSLLIKNILKKITTIMSTPNIKKTDSIIQQFLMSDNFIPNIILCLSVFLLGYYIYIELVSMKLQFEIFSLTPIAAAIMAIITTLWIRNNDNKKKMQLILARREILDNLRKKEYVNEKELMKVMSMRIKSKIIEQAINELISENLIYINENHLIISDNLNMDNYKYKLALTVQSLKSINRQINFGEKLEMRVITFLRNPLKHTVDEAGFLLKEIIDFLNEDSNNKNINFSEKKKSQTEENSDLFTNQLSKFDMRKNGVNKESEDIKYNNGN